MTQFSIEREEKKKMSRKSFLQTFLGFSIFSTIGSVIIPIIGYLIPPTSGGAGGGGRILVGTTSEIPPGQAKIVPVGSKPIIITNSDQGVRAFSAICPHLGCVSVWDQNRQIILCPCHDGQFNAVTGAVISGPPPAPLETAEVLIEGENIYIVGEG